MGLLVQQAADVAQNVLDCEWATWRCAGDNEPAWQAEAQMTRPGAANRGDLHTGAVFDLADEFAVLAQNATSTGAAYNAGRLSMVRSTCPAS